MNENSCRELARRIDARCVGEGLCDSDMAGLRFFRQSSPGGAFHVAYEPSLCVVAQGEKLAMLGLESYRYAAGRFLVVTVDLPLVCRVTVASAEKPYLCLQLDLDALRVNELLDGVEDRTGSACLRCGREPRGLFVGEVDEALSDCLLRLTALLDAPVDIPELGPLIAREIGYRLLHGADGAAVARAALPGGRSRRIGAVIRAIRADIARPVRVEDMARMASMSPSTFFEHFKAITAETPLRYVKRLRLLEARRLMLAGAADAEGAAFRVGYASASQFSREYARMFGAPPLTDVHRLLARGGAL